MAQPCNKKNPFYIKLKLGHQAETEQETLLSIFIHEEEIQRTKRRRNPPVDVVWPSDENAGRYNAHHNLKKKTTMVKGLVCVSNYNRPPKNKFPPKTVGKAPVGSAILNEMVAGEVKGTRQSARSM